MFTGIIQEIGTIARVERSRGVVRLTLYAPALASRVDPMESVAVNGVCLTVVTIRHGTVAFEIITETQRLTNLGTLRRGDRVNLEVDVIGKYVRKHLQQIFAGQSAAASEESLSVERLRELGF